MAGINGGYLLARPSTDISVEDVLNAVEGDYKIEDEEISENCMVKGISKALQRLVIDRINEETGKVIKNVTLRKLADEYSNTDRDADEMYYIWWDKMEWKDGLFAMQVVRLFYYVYYCMVKNWEVMYKKKHYQIIKLKSQSLLLCDGSIYDCA